MSSRQEFYKNVTAIGDIKGLICIRLKCAGRVFTGNLTYDTRYPKYLFK